MARRILIPSLTGLVVVAALFGVAWVRTNYSCWELRRSENAYRLRNYELAMALLEKAASADAHKPSAYLCRAEATMRRTTWMSTGPLDSSSAQRAIADYRLVLAAEPDNVQALKGAAQLLLRIQRLDEARSYYLRVAELRPTDAETFYGLGAISWSRAYQQRMTLAANLGRHANDPLVDLPQCRQLKAAVEQQVDDALRFLQKALSLDGSRSETMAYLNLAYRERAQIQCGDHAAYARDISEADKWVDKTMEAMKAKASQ